MPVLKFRTPNGKQITLKARRDSTEIVQGRERSYTFDYCGRLVSAARGGSNYRRSFSNEILEKQGGHRSGIPARMRRTLPPEEVRELEVEAYDLAGAVSGALRRAHRGCEPETLQAAQCALAHVNAYCYTGLERERASFAQIYHPLPVLPPDQSLAVYLQMTEGCFRSQCTFCHFLSKRRPGRDRRFRIKPPDVFHEHIRRVRAFLGEGLLLRHSIFLGDANALLMPQKMLLPRFDIVNSEFQLMPRGLTEQAQHAWRAANPIHFDGICSFIDEFSGLQKSALEFAELVERGLRRVYVGLESGDPELLRFLGRSTVPDDVRQLVRECKAGGVNVGLIVLVGAGGAKFEQAHIDRTTELICRLPLDEHDLISLSELPEFPGSPFKELEMQHFQKAFAFRGQLHAPRVESYDVREFIY
jgi:hypothetical protein